MKRVEVIDDLCIACGACMQIAKDVFGYNSEGRSKAKKEFVEENDKETIMAMEACPTGAIRMEDAEGNDATGCTCEHCNCDPCECGDECACDDCQDCGHEE